jgi:hypothetical protein
LDDPRVQRLIDWVAQRPSAAGVEIGPDTDLVASGVLDSMGLVSLFFLVETMGGRPVDPAAALAAGPVTPAALVARYF